MDSLSSLVRWGVDPFGGFILFLAFTIPYLCVSVIGGGLAIHLITKGAVSYEAGAFLIIAVVAAYVTAGGMRGTAWVNVYQGFVFMINEERKRDPCCEGN